MSEGRTGPLLGPPVGDHYYATRLRQLARIDVDERQARLLWQAVAAHRAVLEGALGRDVGQRVALLDYLVNVRPHLTEPQIIERATLETIEQQALADALTGLYNRHYFDMALQREVERCRRYGNHSSLVLLDVDQFKGINDGRGHRVGDRVLWTVGSAIRRHVRGADVPCRWGGDEFAILLVDTPEQDALVVALRIATDVRQACALELPGGPDVTCSAGVAGLGSGTAQLEAVVQAADRALYGAKHSGGGCALIAPPAEP